MARIGFGIIQDFGTDKDPNGNPITARVIPEESDGTVSLQLYIPFDLRGVIRNVKENENVFYAVKADGTGIIIAVVPDYTQGEFPDWDFIVRNEKKPLQINGDVHIKGNVQIDKDLMTGGNSLVKGNADVVGNLSADGDVCINTTIEAKGGNLNIDGAQIKLNGMTATGAMAFNGFPAGMDTFTGAPVSQDTVIGAGSIAGGVAVGNEGSYTPIDDNEEREGGGNGT